MKFLICLLLTVVFAVAVVSARGGSRKGGKSDYSSTTPSPGGTKKGGSTFYGGMKGRGTGTRGGYKGGSEYGEEDQQQDQEPEMPEKEFIAPTMFCPTTGRTICTRVEDYPS